MDAHGTTMEYLRGLMPLERCHLRQLLDCESCRGDALQVIGAGAGDA